MSVFEFVTSPWYWLIALSFFSYYVLNADFSIEYLIGGKTRVIGHLTGLVFVGTIWPIMIMLLIIRKLHN